MSKRTSEFGHLAEERAAHYLQSKGFSIKDRNYRFGSKEIDIICIKDDLIVFVEVKATSSSNFGSPESWVTPTKQKNIIIAAQAYLQENEIDNLEIRFDVITYLLQGEQMKLNHLEAAFDASVNL